MAGFHKNSVYKNLWSQIPPASRSSRNPPDEDTKPRPVNADVVLLHPKRRPEICLSVRRLIDTCQS